MNKYHNTYHSTAKMKPVDLKANIYFDFNKENNKEDPKFEVGDHVRISKCQNIFAKCYNLNWSDEVFVIKKFKILVRGRMLLVILMVKKFLEHFTKKNCKKQIKNSLELKKKSKEKMIKYMLSGKVIIIHLIVGLIKKRYCYIKWVIFQNHIPVFVPLYNKVWLKKANRYRYFAKNADLANT